MYCRFPTRNCRAMHFLNLGEEELGNFMQDMMFTSYSLATAMENYAFSYKKVVYKKVVLDCLQS